MRTGITGGEGNEGWCCRVVNTARTVRASRGRHNPLPAVAPRERRDGDASAPPPHGPPTYRERVAMPGRAGLGLSASVKRATWACPSRHRRGTGLYCLRAARRKPDTRRGMMTNASASAVQHEWDGDSIYFNFIIIVQ